MPIGDEDANEYFPDGYLNVAIQSMPRTEDAPNAALGETWASNTRFASGRTLTNATSNARPKQMEYKGFEGQARLRVVILAPTLRDETRGGENLYLLVRIRRCDVLISSVGRTGLHWSFRRPRTRKMEEWHPLYNLCKDKKVCVSEDDKKRWFLSK